MPKSSPTRRSLLRTIALTPAVFAAGSLSAPFVRGAYAAGRLSVGLWDHWVPGASQVIQKLTQEWADKEKVDLSFDLITSNGDKLALTIAAEAQARAGHDILHFQPWYAAAHADKLVPVDDLVKEQIDRYGEPAPGCVYLGKIDGHWAGVPTAYGSSALPPCARIDLLKKYADLDVTKMYPPPGVDGGQELRDWWTWENFVIVAEKCFKGGHPFGVNMSTATDAVNTNDSVLRAYGARLVNEKGNITVKTDEMRQALEWFQRLAKFLPESTFAWDNASNNKFLVSGQGSLIMNPPSAWAVAARDAPQIAENLWTFNSPKGPKGRFDSGTYAHWGIWQFSKNKEAAKALLRYLTTREIQEKLVTAGTGFDIPPFKSMMDFKVWEEAAPPKGTNYNFPPRRDVEVNVSGYPAPPKIGTQMYAQGTICKMITTCTQQGKSIDQAMAVAEHDIEGFMRS
jgi:ABC-type glycerol-3-phosphate transport system substrate-binding protein